MTLTFSGIMVISTPNLKTWEYRATTTITTLDLKSEIGTKVKTKTKWRTHVHYLSDIYVVAKSLTSNTDLLLNKTNQLHVTEGQI